MMLIYQDNYRKDGEKRMDEVYQGLQHGRPIEFSRVFRGHRFTDRECEALVQGSCIAVHNIHGKRGVYAVEGKLIYDKFWKKWKFDTVRMIPNQVDYDFEKQSKHDIYHVDTSVDDVVELNDDDLIGISFDEIRSEIQHMPSVKLSPLKELTASLSQELRRETGYVTKSDIAMDVVVSEEPLQEEMQQETNTSHGLTSSEPSVQEPMQTSQEVISTVTNPPMQSSAKNEIVEEQEAIDGEGVQDVMSQEFVSDIDEDSDDGFAIVEDTDALDEMSEEDWISFLQESEGTSHQDTNVNDDTENEDEDDEDFYGDMDPYEGMDDLFMDELSDNLINSSYDDAQFDAELDALVSDGKETDGGTPVSAEQSSSSDFDDEDFNDIFDE